MKFAFVFVFYIKAIKSYSTNTTDRHTDATERIVGRICGWQPLKCHDEFLGMILIIIIIIIINNNNNNSSFISTADNPQLIHNKLPRRTAQIQSNTNNQL